MQKFNLREQLINSTMDSLKIDKNPFNYATIEKFISHIVDEHLKDFYSKLFDASHQYLNGMDRISKVAESFKPIVKNNDETKAQYLIDLVYAMNTKVFDSARSSGRTFDDELKGTKFLSLSTKESNILSIVKPHINIKTLVANISNYDNGSTQMRVFKQAVNSSKNPNYGIESGLVKKMIKGI